MGNEFRTHEKHLASGQLLGVIHQGQQPTGSFEFRNLRMKPCHDTFRCEVTFLVFTDGVVVSDPGKVSQCGVTDVLINEANRAVTHQDMAATSMKAPASSPV